MSLYPASIDLSDLDGSNGYKINGEDAGDRSGISVASAGDVNGDGFDDVIVGAPGANPDGNDSGASYVVFGMASGFDATLKLSDLDGTNGFKINGERPAHYSGGSVSSAGDVNGDGFDDLLVGAIGASPNSFQSGACYVVFGTDADFAATLELSELDGSNGFKIDGASGRDFCGASVSSAGDVNGDGFADLIVGAWGADPNGAAYVVFGTDAGFDATLELSGLDGSDGFKIDGNDSSDGTGFSVASTGDLNGDGFDDLIVGAPGADPNGAQSGAAYVVFGKASGFDATVELSNLNGTNGFTINGEAEVNYIGWTVASAGDINGDGFADLILGANRAAPNGDFDAGASFVVFGTDQGFGTTLELSGLDGTNGFQIDGISAHDRSGFSVASAGDVNGDGFDDLLIGSDMGLAATASYVVFGTDQGFDATLELSDLDGSNGFKLSDEIAGDRSGWSVSSAGDVNGDGFADLIVGAPYGSPNGHYSGSSYVIFGLVPDTAQHLIGGDASQTLAGGDSNDKLSGRGGDDTLYGNDGRDALNGGPGSDALNGGAGKDVLDGGPGGDIFVYTAASDSTGDIYDAIKHADFTVDAFDVPVAITGIDAKITSGSLSQTNFDNRMEAVVDDNHLEAGHAVLFKPSGGTLSGKTFLIVDLNGVAGYQSGEDLVVKLAHAQHLTSIGAEDFI